MNKKSISNYIEKVYYRHIDDCDELDLTLLGEDVIAEFNLFGNYNEEEEVHELVFEICETMGLV